MPKYKTANMNRQLQTYCLHITINTSLKAVSTVPILGLSSSNQPASSLSHSQSNMNVLNLFERW